jgi:hypothetical protein
VSLVVSVDSSKTALASTGNGRGACFFTQKSLETNGEFNLLRGNVSRTESRNKIKLPVSANRGLYLAALGGVIR